jgi:alkaline phosphatase D
MLDVRQYRDPAPCGGGLGDCPERLDEDRSLLGADQQTWLQASLDASSAVWDVVGQQVVFSPLPFGGAFNNDQWDGYPQQRDRVWAMLRQRPNPVIVTGDIHAAGVAGLHETLGDLTTTRVGTELVGTSISSRFDPALIDAAESIISSLPYIEYANARDRGYTVVELTRDRLVATYKVVSTIDTRDATVSVAYVADVPARVEGEAPPAAPVPAAASFTG